MRFIIANEFYQQMLQVPDHSPDCYVRPGEYLHHMYIDGIKYAVAPAVLDCLAQAEATDDKGAIEHLRLHKLHYEQLLADAERYGSLDGVTLLGDPPPADDEDVPVTGNQFVPRTPSKWEDLGLPSAFLFDMGAAPPAPSSGSELHFGQTAPAAGANPSSPFDFTPPTNPGSGLEFASPPPGPAGGASPFDFSAAPGAAGSPFDFAAVAPAPKKRKASA